MSLLDDVSIVVTPNGYKAGTLFGAIPVPTFGSDEITNGGFATDSDWSKGGNWSIGGGVATANGNSNGNISQTIPLTVGAAYSVTYTVVNASVGSRIGISTNATSIQIERTTDGTYTEIFTASLTSFYIRALWNNGNSVSLDNVSVKEWVGADMDVTRATAATRVDENGLVNYAEVIGGEEVTNRDYTEAGVGNVISQSGGILVNDSNRLKITSDGSSGFSRGVWDTNGSQGERFIIKADVISITGGVRFIDISNNAGTSLVSGTTFEIEIILGSSSKQVGFGGISDTSFELILDNISVKEVTRDNVPRIDYAGCPHILAEPQRTNLITYSEDFSQWATSGSPTLTTGQLSPSGESNATKVSGTIGSTYLSLNGTTSATATRTIYARTVSGTGTAKLMSYNTNTNNLFNLTEEWQRFELTGAISTGATNFYIDFRDNSQTLSEFIIWGAQSEEATYATSYIPTSGSTVTRNQDIFTRDGIGSLINSTEGVLFVEMAALSDDGTNRRISIAKDGNNKINMVLSTSSNTVQAIVISLGSVQFNESYAISDTTLFFKVAIKYKENDFALWINGVEVATDTSGNTFTSGELNKLVFDNSDGNNPFYGKVKQLQVYDTALTDEQLLQLTGESGTDFYESYAEMASALTYTIQ